MRSRLTARLSIAAYVLLLIAAVPWYWSLTDSRVVFGVPLWVFVAIIVSALASVLTALLLFKPWPHEHDSDA